MAWERLVRHLPSPAIGSKKNVAKKSVAKRSDGGRVIGKREMKGIRKNNSRMEEYLSALCDAGTRAEFEKYMIENAVLLARVTRHFGAGHIEVLTQDGLREIVSISGSLKVKGRASSKTDCEFVMSVNDVVLLHGPQVAAKVSKSLYKEITTNIKSLGIVLSVKEFFTIGAIDSDVGTDLAFVFDEDVI